MRIGTVRVTDTLKDRRGMRNERTSHAGVSARLENRHVYSYGGRVGSLFDEKISRNIKIHVYLGRADLITNRLN